MMTQLVSTDGGDLSTPGGIGSPAIAVRGLTKRFGSVAAVDDLTFEVRPGAVTGFLGQNGAGKSTTLRILLGLVMPSAGSASILGMPYRSLSHPSRTVGAVLETQSFNPLRSGRNHLRVMAAASRIDDGRVDEVLGIVDLKDAAERRVGKYSLGMRQRLGLAGALLGEPSVLILDEPANGLDPQGIRWLRDFLTDFAARGNAILVSSHQLGEIQQMADEVIVIDHGALIRQAPVDQLTDTAGEFVVRSPMAQALAEALTRRGFAVSSQEGDRITVAGSSGEQIGTAAFELGVPIFELRQEQASLEDVFLEMTTVEENR
jgi:ABC-2 type transport system ATP-binding protein